jgi:hypothetical protein
MGNCTVDPNQISNDNQDQDEFVVATVGATGRKAKFRGTATAPVETSIIIFLFSGHSWLDDLAGRFNVAIRERPESSDSRGVSVARPGDAPNLHTSAPKIDRPGEVRGQGACRSGWTA